MRKNKFLRLASVMLMLCLITTCAISGTFAKYTTSDEALDSARVAKWGVAVQVLGNDVEMFKPEYAKNDIYIPEPSPLTLKTEPLENIQLFTVKYSADSVV